MTPAGGGGVAQVAAWGGLVAAGLILLLLAAVAVAHTASNARQSRDVRRRADLVPLVHDLLDGADDAGVLRADVVTAPALLDDLILDLATQLRGADRAVLQRVLTARGVVDRAAGNLTARAAWRRGRAAVLLGSAASAAHTDALAALLTDRSADVRSAAARALGKVGDEHAAGPLLDALTGPTAVPAGIIGMALLDLGTPALPTLRGALTSPVPIVGSLAADLLGLHGDAGAASALEAVLDDRRTPEELCRSAAAALGRIGSPNSTAPLTRVLGGSRAPGVRCCTAEALGRIGDPAALPVLIRGLGDVLPEVRAASADAMNLLGSEGRAMLETIAGTDGPAADAARASLQALPVPSGAR